MTLLKNLPKRNVALVKRLTADVIFKALKDENITFRYVYYSQQNGKIIYHPHYVDKLFGIFGGTHRPETASYAACHDNYMILHAGFNSF